MQKTLLGGPQIRRWKGELVVAGARRQTLQGSGKTHVLQVAPEPGGVKVRLPGSEVYNRALQAVKLATGKGYFTHALTMTANQVWMVNERGQDKFVRNPLDTARPTSRRLSTHRL